MATQGQIYTANLIKIVAPMSGVMNKLIVHKSRVKSQFNIAKKLNV